MGTAVKAVKRKGSTPVEAFDTPQKLRGAERKEEEAIKAVALVDDGDGDPYGDEFETETEVSEDGAGARVAAPGAEPPAEPADEGSESGEGFGEEFSDGCSDESGDDRDPAAAAGCAGPGCAGPGCAVSDDSELSSLLAVARARTAASEARSRAAVTPYQPALHGRVAGEELERSPGAYRLYHQLALDVSCLSFAVFPDALGEGRADPPHTMYLACGTQPLEPARGRLHVLKLTGLRGRRGGPRAPDARGDPANRKEKESDGKESEEKGGGEESEGESEEEGSDEEESDAEAEDAAAGGGPQLRFASVVHRGDANRVRLCPQAPRLAAVFGSGRAPAPAAVSIFDVQAQREALEDVVQPPPVPAALAPKFCTSIPAEGFALAWSHASTGVFAVGGHDGVIRVFDPVPGGWSKKPTAIKFNAGSVEDIQWKIGAAPQPSVFAAASVDKSIALWDLVAGTKKPAIQIPLAHDADVNSISWNPFDDDMLLSGGDDGVCRVWDMRHTQEPIVHLNYHKQPVNSVDWHPTDSAVFACASHDDTLSIWDISVEADGAAGGTAEVPEQLMFLHMGQEHISEIKWHPQIPGVLISTAADSIDVFQPCNL